MSKFVHSCVWREIIRVFGRKSTVCLAENQPCVWRKINRVFGGKSIVCLAENEEFCMMFAFL